MNTFITLLCILLQSRETPAGVQGTQGQRGQQRCAKKDKRMLEASMSKSSVLTELEAYVEDFEKKRPGYRVKTCFSELKSSIEKREASDMITRKAEELSVAFPPGHNLDVKRLINKLCKDIQSEDMTTTVQETHDQEEEQSMAQKTGTYTFTEFKNEIRKHLDLQYSATLQNKYQDVVQAYEIYQIPSKFGDVGALEQLRCSAQILKDFIKNRELRVSQDCVDYLYSLMNAGKPSSGKVSETDKRTDQALRKEDMAQKTGTYTFTEFKNEIRKHLDLQYSATLQNKYQDVVQAYEIYQIPSKVGDVGALEQLRCSAQILKDFIKNRELRVSQDCVDYLYSLMNAGKPSSGKVSETDKRTDQALRKEGETGVKTTTTIHCIAPGVDQRSHLSSTQYAGSTESLKDENTRLTKANENRITDLEAKLTNALQAIEAREKEKRELELDFTKQYKEMQTKLMDELENTKSNGTKRLRAATEESNILKTQLEQLAEDSARQKQSLSAEMHRLHGENRQLKSRVSELAGAKLMDNNPDIADLSDPNRAMKLGEKFSSLYDDEWTDHFQILTEKFKLNETDAIKRLLDIMLKTYDFCRRVADEQMDCLCNIFEHPCQNIPKALSMRPPKEKVQMTQKQHKELKDLRKQIALTKVDSIRKQFLGREMEEVKQKGDKTEKSILEKTKVYHEKCIEVCWPMVLHDPPVQMDLNLKPGVRIDGNKFRMYGGNGDTLEYLVWPPLQVQGGGLIAKGVAKPVKVQRVVKKP